MITSPRPDYVIDSFNNISSTSLRNITEDIKVVGIDVDGVLTLHHKNWLDGLSAARIDQLHRAGFEVVLITNSYGDRISELHDIFKDHIAPDDIITPEDVTPYGKNPHDFGKSRPDMLQEACRRYGILANQLMMIDDQLFSGISAANKIGSPSTLVPRRGRHDHPGVRMRRPVEALVRLAQGGPPRWVDFPEKLTPYQDWKVS